MRDAETVLAIIRERGKRGLPLEDVYRQLFNPDLYLRAYGRIYRNDGAMTEGCDTRRPWTGCPWGRSRPSSSCSDMSGIDGPRCGGCTSRRRTGRCAARHPDLVGQAAARSRCAPSWRPTTSRSSATDSHGFRPGRGCHTALQDIYHDWKGTKWFIEGDIKGCFDNIDHQVLLSILREKIHDSRFLAWSRDCSRPDISRTGTTDPPSAARRKAGSSARPREHLPRQAGQVRRSRRSSPNTREGTAGSRTRNT